MKAYVLVNPANNRLVDNKIPNYPSCLPDYKVIYGYNSSMSIPLPHWFVNGGRSQSVRVRLNGYCAYLGHLQGLLSHRDNYPDEDLLILEDDVTFDSNFEEYYKNFMSRVPDDWDAIYLGGWPVPQPPLPKEVAPGVIHPYRMHGLECAILRPSAVNKLLDVILPDYRKDIYQVDVTLANLNASGVIKTYMPLVHIASQGRGFSAHLDRHINRDTGRWRYFTYIALDGTLKNNKDSDLDIYKDK